MKALASCRRSVQALLVTLLLAAPASAHMVSVEPNGGEVIPSGSVLTVKWKAIHHGGAKYRVSYSIDSGSTWTFLSKKLDVLARSFDWVVPNLGTTTARVRVEQFDRTGYHHEVQSESDFTIQLCASLGVNGTPAPGQSVGFAMTTGACQNEDGDAALVLLSATGDGSVTGPIVFPGTGGRKVDLDFDSLTFQGLQVPSLFTSLISAGSGATQTFTMPSLQPGLMVYAAGFTFDPVTGEIHSITQTISVTTQ